MKKKKMVYITGGSGFTGINLVRYLYNKGFDITVIDLVDFDYPDMKNKIKFVKGDIRDGVLVENSMKGCDYVIHTAAALPLYKPKEIFSTDIKGTRNVMESARWNKVERAIHISSTAVYGIPNHHPLYETDKLDGVGHYGKAKIMAEQVCEEFRKKGLCVPIIRPKSFIGKERLGVFAIYFDWIYRGKNIPIIGYGNNRYQLLEVEDLCDAIYLCITKPKNKANDTFNIGAKKFTTVKKDIQAVLDYSGKGKKVIGFPAWPVVFILRILDSLGISPLYKWVYETAQHDSFVSIRKAEKILGYKPKYSNRDAMIRNYDWYVKNVDKFENQSGVTHRVPWKQGALKFISWFF